MGSILLFFPSEDVFKYQKKGHGMFFPFFEWEDEFHSTDSFGAMGAHNQSCSKVINAVVAPFTLGEKLTPRRSGFKLVKGPPAIPVLLLGE